MRNDVSGTAYAPVVQAGRIDHVTLVLVRDEFLLGRRAELTMTALVDRLRRVLVRNLALIGELTRKRDEARLAAARSTRGRTEEQLRRAEAERARAVEITAGLMAKLVEVLEQEPEAAAGFDPGDLREYAVDPDELLADLNAGLTDVDHLLDAQSRVLTGLVGPPAVTGPARDDDAEAARLIGIMSNVDISLTHRVAAVGKLKSFGAGYVDDTAAGIRSLLSEEAVDHVERRSLVRTLTSLAPRFRAEAESLFRAGWNDTDLDPLQRMHYASALVGSGARDRDRALDFIRSVAIGGVEDCWLSDRLAAARQWVRGEPGERGAVLAVLEALHRRPDLPEGDRVKVAELIREIRTDPDAR